MNYLNKTGLTYLWNKIKSTFALKKTITLSLSASDWTLTNGEYYQTVTVSGIKSNSLLVVSGDNGVVATAQGTNSMTFKSPKKLATNVKIINMGEI